MGRIYVSCHETCLRYFLEIELRDYKTSQLNDTAATQPSRNQGVPWVGLQC